MEVNLEDLDLRGRDDVFFKVAFARALLRSGSSPSVELDYLEHLARWNGFWEGTPRKRGSRDFVNSFQSMVQDFLNGNFERFAESIPLSVDGQPLNGSHRIALSIAASQLGLVPPRLSFEKTDLGNVRWTFSYFARLGVSSGNLRKAVLERITFLGSATLTIWPNAQKFKTQIAQIFSEISLPGISFEVRADRYTLSGIVETAYTGEVWAASDRGIESKVEEIGSSGIVTVVPLEKVAAAKIVAAKRAALNLWKNDFQGIHTTDTPLESYRLFSLISHHESIAMLNYIDRKAVRENFLQIMSRTQDTLSLSDFHMTCLSGSQVLGLLGIRKPADVDIISEGQGLLPESSDHSVYLKSFGIDALETLRNADNHFHFYGLKIMNVRTYLSLLKIRKEAKDKRVISLLESVSSGLNGPAFRPNPRPLTAGFLAYPPFSPRHGQRSIDPRRAFWGHFLILRRRTELRAIGIYSRARRGAKRPLVVVKRILVFLKIM